MKSGPSGSEPRTKQGNCAPKRESSLRSVSVMAELSVVFRTLKGGGGGERGEVLQWKIGRVDCQYLVS